MTLPILILGDSISAAYGLPLELGWVELLEERLRKEKLPYTTVNASISGDTSAGALRRLPLLLDKYRPDIVIIELGGNDGLRGYPVEQLTRNIKSMIELSIAAGAEVLVLPMEIPPNMGKPYTDAFRESYRIAIEGTDARLGIFPLEDVALNPFLMQEDGIHPTQAAQPKLLENVWIALEQML